jgi:hypothetical protein
MADDKKPDAKPADKSTAVYQDPFVEFTWILLTLFLFIYLLNGLISSILTGHLSFLGRQISNPKSLFLSIFVYVKYISIILSPFLIAAIIYLYKKIVVLRQEEAKKLYIEKTETGTISNPQWQKILNHTESTNETDWRLAILEADIMLDDLLNNMGLPGDTIADKLKMVEKSDFTTLDNAWEAHKVRNQIAHEGISFMLNQREAKRVIGLYESVFNEFKII